MSETSWGRRKYRTTNWKVYNAALKARGDLTIWLDKDMQWLTSLDALPGRISELEQAAGKAVPPLTTSAADLRAAADAVRLAIAPDIGAGAIAAQNG